MYKIYINTYTCVYIYSQIAILIWKMIVNHQIWGIIFLSNPDVFWPKSCSSPHISDHPQSISIFPVLNPRAKSQMSILKSPCLEAAKDNMFMVQSPFYLSTSLEQILNKRRPKKTKTIAAVKSPILEL